MNTVKELMLASVTGLIIVSAGVAHGAKDDMGDPAISARQAIDIALANTPGQIHELELEHEDDVIAWEVELVSSEDNQEYEILIHATSGEVLEKEAEEDDWSFFGLNAQK